MSGESLFGLNGYPYNLQQDVTYVVSKKLMDKYHVTEEDLCKPLSEIADILTEIQQNEEKENADFTCVKLNMGGITTCPAGLYSPNSYVYGVALCENADGNPVTYVLGDENFRTKLRDIYSITENESLKYAANDETPVYEDVFICVEFSGSLAGFGVDAINKYYDSSDAELTNEDLVQIYPYKSDVRVRDNVFANAVLASSGNKEQAVDFLFRSYYDEELTNILIYGADYECVDGKAYAVVYSDDDGDKELQAVGFIHSFWWGNGFISTPAYNETEDKTALLLSNYENHCYVSEYAGFRFDKTGCETYVESSNAVFERLTELFDGSVDDFDAFMDELLQEYKEAGGEELYNAIQEQWNEFSEK